MAKHRQAEPPKLIHLVRGDLDWIVMKCLEKDRTRRYETANGLAADIQHFLNNEPVVARPPSTLYRFQKLVRRNKLAFAAAGAVSASILIGLVVSTWMFLREKEARRLADREAKRSQQVALFLEDMLKGVGPSVALGRDTTLLQGDPRQDRRARDHGLEGPAGGPGRDLQHHRRGLSRAGPAQEGRGDASRRPLSARARRPAPSART